MGEPLAGVEHGKGGGQPVEASEARVESRPALGAGALAGAGLGLEQPAQRGDLVLELPMLGGEVGKLEPLADKVAYLEHDGPAGGAAIDLDIAVPQGREHQVEGLAPVGQRLDRGIELCRRRRIEPGGKVEKPRCVAGHAKRRR